MAIPEKSGNINLNESGTLPDLPKKMLDDKGLSYEEINIEEQRITREDLVNITGGFSVPQIVINDTCIGGFEKLLQLNQSGELKELLANS